MVEKIVSKARQIIRQCGTRDPFRIARDLDIEILYEDLGRLKGMYAFIKRIPIMMINDRLDSYWKKMVCVHEIGHDCFHRELATDTWLQEFMIYNMKTRPEYEANVFAAEILLPDDDVLELIEMGYDNQQIAGALGTDINLVGMKAGTLIQQGYKFRASEFRDDFLK